MWDVRNDFYQARCRRWETFRLLKYRRAIKSWIKIGKIRQYSEYKGTDKEGYAVSYEKRQYKYSAYKQENDTSFCAKRGKEAGKYE